MSTPTDTESLNKLKKQEKRANVIQPRKNEIPDALLEEAEGAGDLFLDYQKEIVWSVEDNQFTVVPKSRRIGATWGLGGWASTTAGAARSAGGQDVLYIGPSLDMAREFVDVVAQFSKAFQVAASEVQEFLFDDADEHGETRQIKALRIDFASGFSVVALSSHPRSLRGRQGVVIIDEAAFHDDLAEVLKAALALLMWGGKVVMLSTHDGETNHFNEVINEIRAGNREGNIVEVTFQDALDQGLYKRICFVNGIEWTQERQDKWEASIRSSYGSAAAEELDAIPSQGQGAVLALSVIEKNATPDVPVVRFEAPKDLLMVSEGVRSLVIEGFLRKEVLPVLERRVNRSWPSYLGQDFARKADLSVIWPLQVSGDTTRVPPLIIELANTPHECQKTILWAVIDALPRFSGAALDAGGNGSYLAEVTATKYGTAMIEEVMLTQSWYRENMPRFISKMSDFNFQIPRDREVIDDMRQLRRDKGIIKVPDKRTASKETGAKRHGDSAIAAALAEYATTRDPVEYTGALTAPRETDDRQDDSDLDMRSHDDDDLPSGNWKEGTF